MHQYLKAIGFGPIKKKDRAKRNIGADKRNLYPSDDRFL